MGAVAISLVVLFCLVLEKLLDESDHLLPRGIPENPLHTFLNGPAGEAYAGGGGDPRRNPVRREGGGWRWWRVGYTTHAHIVRAPNVSQDTAPSYAMLSLRSCCRSSPLNHTTRRLLPHPSPSSSAHVARSSQD